MSQHFSPEDPSAASQNPSPDYLFPSVNKQRSIKWSSPFKALFPSGPPIMKRGCVPTEVEQRMAFQTTCNMTRHNKTRNILQNNLSNVEGQKVSPRSSCSVARSFMLCTCHSTIDFLCHICNVMCSQDSDIGICWPPSLPPSPPPPPPVPSLLSRLFFFFSLPFSLPAVSIGRVPRGRLPLG